MLDPPYTEAYSECMAKELAFTTAFKAMTSHLTPATVREITECALDVINDQTGIRFNKFLTKEAEQQLSQAIELALLHSHLTA